MAYSARDASNTLFGYLGIDKSQVNFIADTNNRGFVYTIDGNNMCVIFIYPISHKADDSKNFFDTRDSGARERGIAWNYALTNRMKYFCLGVHDGVEKYKDYIFSLESDEGRIAEVSGTINGVRGSGGTQVVIPNNYIPSAPFDRILTRNNFYIAVIHKNNIKDYIEKYDNRPYMTSKEPIKINGDSDGSVDNEDAFKEFLAGLVKADGSHYSETSRNAYISSAKAAAKEFPDQLAPFISMFQINDIDSFDKYEKALRSAEGFSAFNDAKGNGALSACLMWYSRFLKRKDFLQQSISFQTGYFSEFSRNRILFGAPGTGKSFTLNREKDVLLADGGKYERVTFHPDYSYANFVGTYKPVPCKDSEGKDAITYKYVPGPFMRIYVEALKNSRTDNPKPFLLVIEEINRANVAAVFGDVFQLLDRGDDEVSEYPIQASEDIKKYLADELGGKAEDYNEVCIPDNMFIWATMNSADQGVFPMDTAFKRRWDFTYLGIDDSENGIVGKKVVLGQGVYRRLVEWNKLRKAINEELLTYKVNEDKLLGPYFIAKKNLPEDDVIDPVTFTKIFKNKVIMYLFDDAAKQKQTTLFGGCEEKSRKQYSKICREFDEKGVHIFCNAIRDQFVDEATEGNDE